jgi:HEAT repeat protein
LAWYINGREIGDPEELISRLAKQLDSTDRKAQFEAVEALGQLGGSAVPHLAKSLSTEVIALSLCTLRALVEIGVEAKPAIPDIEKLRLSSDKELRRETLVALFLLVEAQRASLFRELLLESDLDDVAGCREWHTRLAELGEPTLVALDTALDDDESGVRLRAVDVVARLIRKLGSYGWGRHVFPEAAIVKLLEKAERDKDPGVSGAARKILELRQPGGYWPYQITPRMYGSIIPVVG